MGYKMKKKPASMRVKVEKTEMRGHVCGECARGCWNRENLNWCGMPFLIYCDFSTYSKTKDGRGVCFDSTPACPEFLYGSKGGEV